MEKALAFYNWFVPKHCVFVLQNLANDASRPDVEDIVINTLKQYGIEDSEDADFNFGPLIRNIAYTIQMSKSRVSDGYSSADTASVSSGEDTPR